MGNVRLAAIVLVCLSGLACKRATPGYCGGDDAKCTTGMVCNPKTLLCEASDGGLAGQGGGVAGAAGGAAGAAGAAGAGGSGGEVAPGCTSDNDCVGSDGGAACVLDGGTCVECVKDSHCRDKDKTKPLCDNQVCRACRWDIECDPVANNEGICVVDGHCATADELVYVQNVATCVAGTDGGTADHPFCTPEQGIAALGPDKSILIVRGQVGPWSLVGPPNGVALVTVVGQQNATVMATDVTGISISNQAKLSIRGLHVTGGMGAGIAATAGATLFVDRCRIDSNARGGIVINGAAYQITNSVLSNNGSIMASGTNTVTYGAVEIRNSGSLQPTIFQHNTVASNVFGLSCDQAYPITASIVSPNTLGNAGSCSIMPCCTATAADFTSDYHLVYGSACIDQVDDPSTVSRDIDGQPRPRGTHSDCGADEYYP
jgi:hypothetical protein